MTPVTLTLLSAACLLAPITPKEPKIPVGTLVPGAMLEHGPTADAPFGYEWKYESDGKGGTVKRVRPYTPREGDWLFFDDMSPLWTKLYKMADTAPPFHAGIVVKKPDGTLGVLESGPDDTLTVYTLDIVPRLYTFKGILQIRCIRKPLTPEQSAMLTDFAARQTGKRYAMWRLLSQGTPIKTKGGPVREALAHTLYNRNRWLCAEIVVSASAYIGVTDGKKIRGSNTYPLDIIGNDKHPELAGIFEDYTYWAPHK